jgi:hypothetical protein
VVKPAIAPLRAALGLGLLALAACASDAIGNDLFTARDSAGIRIVEFDSSAASRVPQWTTASEPDLRIDNREDDPRYQFFFIADAIPVPSGIAVAVSGANEIRIYDEAGEHVRTIGRAGEGPGEFSSIGWLQLLGADTIVAYDRGLRRISVFDRAGELVRDVAIHRTPASLEREAMQGPQPRGILADGSVLVALYVAPTRLDGLYRPPVRLHRFSADGTPGDSIAGGSGDDIYILPQGDGRAVVMRPPFARITGFLAAHDGFWIADTDGYELRRHDTDGALRLIVRRAQAGAPVTPDLLDTFLAARLAAYPAGPQREEARELANRIAVHNTLPGFSIAHVAADGRVWVRDYTVPEEDSRSWSVFSRNGELEGRVSIPPTLRVLRFGTNDVIGVLTDDLDRESIARYPFEQIR